MAGAAVMLAVERIEELLSSPSAARWSGWSSSIKKQLSLMSPELRSIGAVVDDDECRGVANEYVQQWRAEVVDAVYCLKDAMDDVVYFMETKEHYVHSYSSSKLPHLVARLAHFALLRRARRRIAGEIHEIRRRLRAGYEEMHGLELAIDAAHKNSRSGRPQRLTSGLPPAVEPVGREEERARLMELLEGREGDDPKTTTISVVGMGGIGKTTLVQMLFHDNKIRALFGSRVWVTLTNRFEANDVLKTMLKQLGDDDVDDDVLGVMLHTDSTDRNPHDRLVRRLKDKLQDKTYLAVLDDVWSIDALNQILAALPLPHLTSSRVLVTTRNKNVAAGGGGSHFTLVEMEALSTDQAWALFCNSAFPDIGECPPELVPIAQSIVNECGGLPQALALNGSLLRGRERNVSEWERFLLAAKSEALAGNVLMNVLLHSFYELPSQIKPCLLYLGLFPKGRSLKCSKIARLWRAEGFIHAADGQDPDQVSDHYLSELVERSLVQTFKVDSSGRMLRFRIHDLMHDAIVAIAQKINFLSHSDQGAPLSTLGQPPPRRLATKSIGCPLDSSSSPCVRTLVLSSGANELSVPLLSPFTRLKVLHLKGTQLSSFPLEILSLFHLRYLHLRKTSMRELPEDIWKLQNLQTLDLKRSPVAELPKGIVKLRHLRHLLVYEQIFLGVECPTGMDGLTSLEKLSNLNITRGGGQLEELGRMTQLKRLGITYLCPENGVHLCQSISRMSRLQSLYLYSGDDQQFLKVDTLSTDSTSLRCINFRGRLTSLPNLASTLASLTKLRLNFSKLLTDPFSSLQHSLNNLVELYLHNDAYLGEELHAQGGGFRMLRKLYVQNLSILKRSVIDRGAMINLEYLELIECKKLERVPRGIEHLSHLKEFHLGMVHGSCIDSIRRGTGEDWDKVKHIPVLREIFRERGRLYRRPL